MAEIKVPIKIDGFKCVEDMAQAVLNYTYKGRTLKEWADSISEPQTNADRIRAMPDEELSELFETLCPSYEWTLALNGMTWFGWLKQEANDEQSD